MKIKCGRGGFINRAISDVREFPFPGPGLMRL